MTSPWWRLPDAPLRTSVALAIGSGCLGAVALALAVASWLDAGTRYPLTVLGLFAALMAIALGRVGAYHPFPRFGPANQVTTARAILVAMAAGLIGGPDSIREAWTAIALVAATGALDGVDGWLARRSGMASRFGARFDMETDALLILVLSTLVWQHDKAGAWVVLAGAMRYAFVAAGWCLPWMAAPLSPTFRGKAVAIFQLVGLSFALSPVLDRPRSTLVAVVTLVALAWSFAVDVRRLWVRR